MARQSKRKDEGHGAGVEDRKACCIAGTNFTSALGCLGLCPRWPEATVHRWSKESGRGQWPWIGLKDANIGAKWLVILREHAVGGAGGQRFRGYSSHNTTSSRCLQTAVCLYTHSWHVFLLCARARMHMHHRFDHKPALLISNVIHYGITELYVW